MAHIIILMDAEVDATIGNASTGSNLLTLKERYHTLDDALSGLSGTLETRVHSFLDAVSNFLLVAAPEGSLTSTINNFIETADELIELINE